MAAQQLRLGEAPAAYLADGRPMNLGPVQRITYNDSNSLLTPGSGFMKEYKFIINPYSGCGFGCDYCYARFFAANESDRDSWGEWIRVKQNARELVEAAGRPGRRTAVPRLQRGDPVYMASVTDPYQPIEAKCELTRDILKALIPLQPRLTIQTRSPIATRDIDLFTQFERIRVNFTISTDSEEVRLRYEPHCPSIDVRIKAAATIASAGVKIGVSISPMLPIKDPERFGRRIADLHAAEYVTQYFKDPRTRFSAGSTVAALEKTRADGWGKPQYERTKAILARILGSERPLLEGMAGYAPA